jgi:hypothetical protein
VDYTLWDTTLSPSFSANAVAWADLGGGNALGFHAFTAGDDYQVVGIALNTAGLTALNSATGTTYLFGGSVAIAPGATLTHAVFTRSQQTPAADVTLDLTWDEIPAPGAGALVALGGLMAARRRRGNGVSA